MMNSRSRSRSFWKQASDNDDIKDTDCIHADDDNVDDDHDDDDDDDDDDYQGEAQLPGWPLHHPKAPIVE